jgi:hypothetical protein
MKKVFGINGFHLKNDGVGFMSEKTNAYKCDYCGKIVIRKNIFFLKEPVGLIQSLISGEKTEIKNICKSCLNKK